MRIGETLQSVHFYFKSEFLWPSSDDRCCRWRRGSPDRGREPWAGGLHSKAPGICPRGSLRANRAMPDTVSRLSVLWHGSASLFFGQNYTFVTAVAVYVSGARGANPLPALEMSTSVLESAYLLLVSTQWANEQKLPWFSLRSHGICRLGLGRVDIFTIVTLQNHEHGVSLHSYGLVNFLQILEVSAYRLYIPFNLFLDILYSDVSVDYNLIFSLFLNVYSFFFFILTPRTCLERETSISCLPNAPLPRPKPGT